MDEFRKLLESTEAMDPERRLVYLGAGLSGLRYKEVKRLQKRDIRFADDGSAMWHLRAEATKGRRVEVVPMMPELAEELHDHWASLPKTTSAVFDTMPTPRTIMKDHYRAGLATREGTFPNYTYSTADDEDRCLGFHALRYFFATTLARILRIQEVRVLMRHKSITQTFDTYVKLGLTDATEDMMRLPRVLGESAGAQTGA